MFFFLSFSLTHKLTWHGLRGGGGATACGVLSGVICSHASWGAHPWTAYTLCLVLTAKFFCVTFLVWLRCSVTKWHLGMLGKARHTVVMAWVDRLWGAFVTTRLADCSWSGSSNVLSAMPRHGFTHFELNSHALADRDEWDLDRHVADWIAVSAAAMLLPAAALLLFPVAIPLGGCIGSGQMTYSMCVTIF